jgi:hypothetical protein
MCETYVTTFCNFPHDLKDGKPIEHECYILRPAMLQMEAEQGAEAVQEYMRKVGARFRTNTIMRRGKRKPSCK